MQTATQTATMDIEKDFNYNYCYGDEKKSFAEAINELAKEFEGAAEKAGFKNEEEMQEYVKSLRQLRTY